MFYREPWKVALNTGVAVSILTMSQVYNSCAPSTRFATKTATTKSANSLEGYASYYAVEFHGRKTASGETYDMHAMTAAHRTLPFGTIVRVTNTSNGKTVVVRINDRGPFKDERIIDLSLSAAKQIGLIGPGTAWVRLEILESGSRSN
jgi:rare lipoprotein A